MYYRGTEENLRCCKMAKYPAQDRYRERQAGPRELIRLTVWIPAESREQLIKLAAKLRRLARLHGAAK